MIVSRCVRALGAFFESLVHASAQDDALLAARNQAFIASHMISGLVALLVFPVYLSIWGQPSLETALIFAWFLSPVAIALYVARTGKLVVAHFASAANLVGLCGFAAWLTGGIGSFLIAWMAMVPIEAALSANRKAVFWATALAVTALLGLAAATAFGAVPQTHQLAIDPVALWLLGVGSATVYGAGLAVSVQTVYARSEDAVRQGERRYRLMAENATDMLTRHDARGRVTFASPAAEQIVGAQAAVLLGDGLFQRVHVADRPAYLTALSASLSQSAPYAVEFRVRRGVQHLGESRDPLYVWVEMRCRPILLTDDAGGSVIAVTRDISERKEQEEEVLRARDAAQSASRAKSQFLANMSHELRTPLNAVIGFSEILNRELYGALGDKRYLEYARLIHDSGQHLLHVVNDVLDMSKIEAGKFSIVKEHFDATALLRSSCDLMRDLAARKSIGLVVIQTGDLPELAADKRACKQMLLNLLSNAIKFTDEGGTVEVAARLEGGRMRLSVSDNGIGIAEDDIARLGAPFVQANTSYDRKHDGAGLGLSVVKGLAQLHGGALEIESVLGRGTVVSVVLPLEAQTIQAGASVTALRLSA